jgi:hypothetical protein
MRTLLAVLALAAVFAQPVVAESPQLADKPRADKPRADKPQADKPQAATPQVRPLDGDEFARYMKALDSVMTIRSDAEKQFLADPEKGRDASVAAALMEQARDAMESNGFTNESFNTIHWNVMQAFAQLEIQANAKDVEATLTQQRQELAAAKGTIPEEQFAVAAKRLEHTEALLKGFGGVPDENIALVRENIVNLKATFERGMGGVKSGYQKQPQPSANR